MRKDKLQRLYPLLRVISKLSDQDRQVLIRYLTHNGCEAIFECAHNTLRNQSIPEEERRNLQQHYMKKKKHFKRLFKPEPQLPETATKEEKLHAAEKFAERRKRTLVNVSDDLGLILKTSLPLIQRYLKANGEDGFAGQQQQQQQGAFQGEEEEEEQEPHSMREAHYH
jgi:hypothetical protein